MAAKGMIIIDEGFCKGCTYCISACPYDLIELGEGTNSQGYQPATYIDPEGRCTGCAACAVTCPEVAIEVYKESARS